MIARMTARFKARHANNQKRFDRMKDWYPNACGTLPIEYGRLVCQRVCMWWDADLRRQYYHLCVILIFALAAGGITYGLAMKWTLAQVLMGVLAHDYVQALVTIWRGSVKHAESTASSDRVRQTLQTTWADAMKNTLPTEVLTLHSRHLQDELLDRARIRLVYRTGSTC